MRKAAARTLLVFLTACAASVASAQTASSATRDTIIDAPDTTGLAGPGRISASPTQPAAAQLERGVAPAMPSRSGRIARLLGNGTALDYGQGGANAIGNTGGVTTGAAGSAGALAGGGGVHAGAIVIPAGAVNGAMRDDPREHVTTNNDTGTRGATADTSDRTR